MSTQLDQASVVDDVLEKNRLLLARNEQMEEAVELAMTSLKEIASGNYTMQDMKLLARESAESLEERLKNKKKGR